MYTLTVQLYSPVARAAHIQRSALETRARRRRPPPAAASGTRGVDPVIRYACAQVADESRARIMTMGYAKALHDTVLKRYRVAAGSAQPLHDYLHPHDSSTIRDYRLPRDPATCAGTGLF